MTTRKGRYPAVYGQTWVRRRPSVFAPRDSFEVGREWRERWKEVKTRIDGKATGRGSGEAAVSFGHLRW